MSGSFKHHESSQQQCEAIFVLEFCLSLSCQQCLSLFLSYLLTDSDVFTTKTGGTETHVEYVKVSHFSFDGALFDKNSAATFREVYRTSIRDTVFAQVPFFTAGILTGHSLHWEKSISLPAQYMCLLSKRTFTFSCTRRPQQTC